MQKVIPNLAENRSDYLYPLLQNIKARPGMYLGRPAITRLKMLLLGYSLARRELGLPLTDQEKAFDGFQHWVTRALSDSVLPSLG